MILRLWAMYSRSKLILRVFLPLFSLELISSIICAAFYSDPRILPGDITQISGFSLCVWHNHLPSVSIVGSVLQMTNGTALCIFAIAQFVKQSKQWQPNQYIDLLVKQGILYFIYFFMYNLITLLNTLGISATVGWQLLIILQYVPMYILTPRFMLSIRELYARDVQGRRGEGIDTGFGLLSSSRGTAIMFADVEPSKGLEDDVQGRVGDGIDGGFGLSPSGRATVG
ncbi:hypothetical protein HD554DRAFT_1616316 [Boletus coccyginus]|nr:hypothetical protein HD554DRAFT_1616316 [Boletus coccyginus]